MVCWSTKAVTSWLDSTPKLNYAVCGLVIRESTRPLSTHLGRVLYKLLKPDSHRQCDTTVASPLLQLLSLMTGNYRRYTTAFCCHPHAVTCAVQWVYTMRRPASQMSLTASPAMADPAFPYCHIIADLTRKPCYRREIRAMNLCTTDMCLNFLMVLIFNGN